MGGAVGVGGAGLERAVAPGRTAAAGVAVVAFLGVVFSGDGDKLRVLPAAHHAASIGAAWMDPAWMAATTLETLAGTTSITMVCSGAAGAMRQ